MRKQVLVPLDGTMLGHTAVASAAALAHATRSRLLLLHVMTLLPSSPAVWGSAASDGMSPHRAQRLATMHNYLEAVSRSLRDEGLLAFAEIAEGDPATVIVDRAQNDPTIHTVAMSTQSSYASERWIARSVAYKVLRSSPVPLLLTHPGDAVPTQNGYRRAYRKILVPLDASSTAEAALGRAYDIATATGASLHLLAVARGPGPGSDLDPGRCEPGGTPPAAGPASQPGNFSTAALRSYLADTAGLIANDGVTVSFDVVHGDPAQAIARSAEQSGADLIVMSMRERSGLARLWSGGAATDVLEHAAQPVLIVPVQSSGTLQRREAPRGVATAQGNM